MLPLVYDELRKLAAGHLAAEKPGHITPGDDQHRHGPASFGEVDVDVAEVGFAAVARRMVERDERHFTNGVSNKLGMAEVMAFTNRVAAPPRISEAVDRLIELYTARDKPDEIMKWQDAKAKLPKPEAPQANGEAMTPGELLPPDCDQLRKLAACRRLGAESSRSVRLPGHWQNF